MTAGHYPMILTLTRQGRQLLSGIDSCRPWLLKVRIKDRRANPRLFWLHLTNTPPRKHQSPKATVSLSFLGSFRQLCCHTDVTRARLSSQYLDIHVAIHPLPYLLQTAQTQRLPVSHGSILKPQRHGQYQNQPTTILNMPVRKYQRHYQRSTKTTNTFNYTIWISPMMQLKKLAWASSNLFGLGGGAWTFEGRNPVGPRFQPRICFWTLLDSHTFLDAFKGFSILALEAQKRMLSHSLFLSLYPLSYRAGRKAYHCSLAISMAGPWQAHPARDPQPWAPRLCYHPIC